MMYCGVSENIHLNALLDTRCLIWVLCLSLFVIPHLMRNPLPTVIPCLDTESNPNRHAELVSASPPLSFFYPLSSGF